MTLSPRAILRVYNSDTEALGKVVYAGDSLVYDLPGLMGSPGTSYRGFQRDPSGRYLMQQMVPLPFDAPPSAWTLLGGALGSSFSYGTSAATGKKFLYHGVRTDAFNLQFGGARVRDEGFYATLFLGAGSPASVPAFYLEFSRGRSGDETGLRLAFVPGAPIRLQASYDNDATWTDVASADALGECEQYLDQNNRYCPVNVLPMCDANWYAGLPQTLSAGKQPPNRILVSIGGGDAVLEYVDDRLAAGNLAITGQNRAWHAELALLRFAVSGSVVLAPQPRPEPFQSDPVAFLNGYVPPPAPGGSSLIDGQVILDSVNSAHVEMTLSATPDATGYALRSCFLATVEAEFPAVQIDPIPDAGYTDYEAIYSEVRHSWDQTTSTLRHVAYLMFSNEQDQFAPGALVALGVRAARLYHSIDPSAGPDDFPAGTILENIGGTLFALEMTGWTAMEEDGQGWIEEGNLKFFSTTLSDPMVHTEEDTEICCGYQLPYDYECQYYAMGQQAYRLGIPDSRWTFPVVRRGQATPYYYLDGGTTLSPVHQFQPSDGLAAAMEHIRQAGAEYDPVTQQPQPMVLGTDTLGRLVFAGMTTGVIDCLLNPGISLSLADLQMVKIFRAAPGVNNDGTPALDEFLETWSSKSSLRRIRTPVVLCGLDPQTGSIIFGVAYNEAVGAGAYADPNAAGYIGVNKPLYVISRLYSSQAVADLSARKAAILLASPSITSGGKLHLQPGLMPLMVIGVQNYTTQGTDGVVGYYATHVTGVVDNRQTPRRKGETMLSARILGRA